MKKTLGIIGLLILSTNTFAFNADKYAEILSADKLAQKGIITNIPNGIVFIDLVGGDYDYKLDFYGINNTITRKEIMKIVMKLSEKNVVDQCNGSFPDVVNDWGCKYIESALSYGFITANDIFRPNESISKAEAMKLILKAKGIEKTYNTDSWQADYMNTALDAGIVKEEYTDHNAAALRGWIFTLGTAKTTVEDALMSDEVMLEDTMMAKEEEVMMKKELSGYQDYSKDLLGMNDDTVIFFHASWCPSCRAADTNFNGSEIEDFLLLKADYDTSTDLRKKYGVTGQHTFVQVNEDGEMITKWFGGSSVSNIKSQLQ